MAIDFPASPNINDTHTAAGRTWTWNGTSWVVTTNASNYTLPIATAGSLGGIKVGPNLNINATSGVLDVDLSAYSLVGHSHSYSLNSLTDVDTTGAANGKILKHNGTSWVIGDDTGGGGTDTNDYVDAASLNSNILVIGRTGALADLSVDLSPLSSPSSTQNQAEYTSPGTYWWNCPAGVTSVCVVAVGGGGFGAGDGGGGGGLGWKNNITVVPGQNYLVEVGGSGSANNGAWPAGSGGDSYFINDTTVKGGGGGDGGPSGNSYVGVGGTWVGDGGGDGGDGSTGAGWGGGGGGAGGYAGNGGDAGQTSGNGGAGGGGGGAAGHTSTDSNDAKRKGGGGGGVGIRGQGTSGAGAPNSTYGGDGGFGGSGGEDGDQSDTHSSGKGGAFGGGSGGTNDPSGAYSRPAGTGAVRIMWGAGRSYPSTDTENQYISTFTGLHDTPNTFTADKWLKVNSGGTALEWTDAPSGGGATITNNADNRIITGSATAGELNAEASFQCDGNALFLSDDKRIDFGSNLRMQMYTDGSVNYIKMPTDGPGAFPLSIHSGSDEVIKIDDGHTQILTGIKDKDGDLGTAGQILSSTGTQVDWIDAPSGGGGGGNVSVGTVVLWSGSSSNIPTGWQLCDGTNGSPDLRDKFVIGAGSTYNPDATGGTADWSLPAHSHVIDAFNNTSGSDGPGILGIGQSQGLGTITTNDAGSGSGTGDNLPPYYALCYIYCTTASTSATQVNADWNATSGLEEILNKPTVVSAFSNDAGYLTTQAQVDWTAVSGVTSIANKPNFATVATTGSYTDLTNTPSIPSSQIQSDWGVTDSSHTAYIENKPTIPAAQVQSDWSATSGMGEILNKPTVPTNNSQLTNGAGYTTFTGSYNDLTDKPTIPANEEIQDIVGAMVTNNTETGVAVTYEDSTGTLDFTLDPFNMDDIGNTSVSGASNGDILKYNSSNGNWEAQAESGAASASVPSGSQMLFYNSAAPTGWIKITSSVDNRALRVVSGQGANSGGSQAFTTVFSQQSVSISVSDSFSGTTGGSGGATYSLGHSGYSGSLAFSGATSNHTLSSGELPSHSHNFHRTRWSTAAGGGGDAGAEVGTMSSSGWNETNLQNHGSGVGHNHDFAWVGADHRHTQGQLNLADHQHSFSGSMSGSGSDSIDLRVQYLDVIICTKT